MKLSDIGHFHRRGLSLWRIIPFVVFWSVWKEGNDKIFQRWSLLEDFILVLNLRIAKWILVRKDFNDFCVNDILFNWELAWRMGWLSIRVSSYGCPLHSGSF